MGMIPEDVIGEIRSRADIVAVIGQHVQLRKAGQSHKGLCPFHSEKSPSFNVNGAKGFFYCFGCQKKGDVFTFVMEYEGKSFSEAAEALARLTGVTLPERVEDPAARRAAVEARSEKAQLFKINQLACEFFRERLAGAAGAAGRAYLAERGVGEEIATRFQLGYAPDEWGALADFLAQKKVPARLAESVGLIAPRQRAGGHYDRFRHRLVCPVMMTGGEVVGFSARQLAGAAVTASNSGGDPPAKYINSPESAIYKKSKLLYGLYQARDGMRQTGRAVLVEGNFDVISLHQAGVTETVAPLGTALTEEQAELLRRLAGKVILLYDGDKAGRAATLKALRVLIAAGVDVAIVALPAGEDPDSLAQKRGPAALAALFARPRPAVEYFIDHVWSTTDRSSAAYAAAMREAAALLPAVKDELRRRHLVDHLASALGVPVERARGDLRAAYRGQAPQPAAAGEAPKPVNSAQMPLTEEMDLLAYLADFPDLLPVAEELDVVSLLTDVRLRDMYSAASGGRPIWSSSPEISPEIAAHVLSGAKRAAAHPERALRDAVAGLRKRREKETRQRLLRQLEQAERRRDDDLTRELHARQTELLRQPKE
ncbi:MAG TPA: DNA primase [Kofleriaceae bacterium]|nr:DNA primase [Kofleriaceae bacterium]